MVQCLCAKETNGFEQPMEGLVHSECKITVCQGLEPLAKDVWVCYEVS